MTRNATNVVPAIHEFRSVHGECPEVADDLSIPQFFLDSWHPLRPARPVGSPWFIDDESGETSDYEKVRLTFSALLPPFDFTAIRFDHKVMVLRKASRRSGT